MFRIRFLAGAAVIGFATLIGCSTKPTAPSTELEVVKLDIPDQDVKELARGNNAFALDLYKKITETEKGNIIVSPYSIRTALAMTYAGARGQTADEMKKVLHFTLADEKLHAAMGGVTDSFQTAGKNRAYQLNIANALWAQQGMKLLPGFLDTTNKHYAAGVREVDFIGNTEASRGTINKWVEDQTQDKIKELLKSGDIDDMTRLVLTNAVYFQGKWKQRFEVKNTRPGDFEIEPGKKVQVPMMSQEEMKIRSSHTSEFSLLELPYQGDRWRMVFLLPEKRHGLKEVEETLSEKQLKAAIADLKDHVLSVNIPKFKFKLACGLREQLSDLGMPVAFVDGRADFSGMGGGLHIANVIHQAMIEVDEEGTVAAAATGVTMQAVSYKEPYCLDQPFLVILRDNATGTILFMGKVVDPR